MKLSDDERAELVAVLADSLGDGHSEAEIDAAWLAEARRRLQSFRSGNVTAVSSEEVESELDLLISTHASTRVAG